jgi:hypothetical protein
MDQPYPQGVPANAQSDLISQETGLPPVVLLTNGQDRRPGDNGEVTMASPGGSVCSELIMNDPGCCLPPLISQVDRNGDNDENVLARPGETPLVPAAADVHYPGYGSNF